MQETSIEKMKIKSSLQKWQMETGTLKNKKVRNWKKKKNWSKRNKKAKKSFELKFEKKIWQKYFCISKMKMYVANVF